MEIALMIDAPNILKDNQLVEYQDNKAVTQTDRGFTSVFKQACSSSQIRGGTGKKLSNTGIDCSNDEPSEASEDGDDMNTLSGQQTEAGIYAISYALPNALFDDQTAMVKNSDLKGILMQSKTMSRVTAADINSEKVSAGAALGAFDVLPDATSGRTSGITPGIISGLTSHIASGAAYGKQIKGLGVAAAADELKSAEGIMLKDSTEIATPEFADSFAKEGQLAINFDHSDNVEALVDMESTAGGMAQEYSSITGEEGYGAVIVQDTFDKTKARGFSKDGIIAKADSAISQKTGIIEYDGEKAATAENNDPIEASPMRARNAFHGKNMGDAEGVLSKPATDKFEASLNTSDNDFITGNMDFASLIYPNENSEPEAALDSIGAAKEHEQGMDMLISKESLLTRIVERYVVNIQDGKTDITIKLKPKELGNITVNITSENGKTKASIFTDNLSVESIIQSQLTELKDLLTAKGISLTELQVSYNANGSNSFQNQQFDGNAGRNAENGGVLQRNVLRSTDKENSTNSEHYVKGIGLPGTINCLI